MVSVEMTRSIKDRPPKIFGLFTRKQFIGVFISGAVVLLCLVFLPFDLLTRFLVSLVPVLPIMVLSFYPENLTSPSVFFRYYLTRLAKGKSVSCHDGNSSYFRTLRNNRHKKITRHRDYPGIR